MTQTFRWSTIICVDKLTICYVNKVHVMFCLYFKTLKETSKFRCKINVTKMEMLMLKTNRKLKNQLEKELFRVYETNVNKNIE